MLSSKCLPTNLSTQSTTMNFTMRSLWFITSLSLAPTILAHVQMIQPIPINSPKGPTDYPNPDYDYTSPLNPDGSNYPCKGYQTDTPIHIAATYCAGQTYEMDLDGSATHGGGSCQISLSYNTGKTFKVIKSMIGGCPLTETYNFTIPSEAPSGDALLAWTWMNHEGNRELYMNCAWVDIDGSNGGSLDSLPTIWVANVQGVTDCTTTESEDPVFPNPGPDVVYGGSMSSSSPASPGDCEAGGSSSGDSSSSGGSAPSSSGDPSPSSSTDPAGGMLFENAVAATEPASSSAPAAMSSSAATSAAYMVRILIHTSSFSVCPNPGSERG